MNGGLSVLGLPPQAQAQLLEGAHCMVYLQPEGGLSL
jgi:hypothetical protein